MDMITAGIDVSKDRLDVVVRPSGETFAVERNADGLELLCLVQLGLGALAFRDLVLSKVG